MMIKVYWRCNGGDYFCTRCCPFDGWTAPEVDELIEAVSKLASSQVRLSIAALRAEGVSENAIRRCIILEFGDDKSTFDGLSPGLYVIEGKSYKLHELGPQFK